jgi:hypothetical protein
MNQNEKKMVELLERGKEKFGVVSVKAEFEAEGTRMDELLRLVEITRSANLPITVKIGGCEAIRDLLESKQIGVHYVVAPMVESGYALEKYVAAKNLIFSQQEQEDMDFLFNMETIQAFDLRMNLLEIAARNQSLQGVVFGRVDFVGSMGLSRERIEQDDVTEKILEVSKLCEEKDLDLVVGGAISAASIENLKKVAATKLTRFETRKVVFDGQSVRNDDLELGLLNAVHFELLWLINKKNYYSQISSEDNKRIEMLENRWKVLNGPVL